MTITFQPVEGSNWGDLEKFFESRGCPHYCWCTVWRKRSDKQTADGKAGRKEVLKSYVEANTPVGILAYDGDESVAWCSVAPRETYRNLGGDSNLRDVWSLVCFFVKRPYRNQGLATKLIQEACRYAETNGAKYLEAYPTDPGSPSYLFMGFRPMFEKEGFEFIKKVGTRRNVMSKALS